jgi:hypothetical protein
MERLTEGALGLPRAAVARSPSNERGASAMRPRDVNNTRISWVRRRRHVAGEGPNGSRVFHSPAAAGEHVGQAPPIFARCHVHKSTAAPATTGPHMTSSQSASV